MIRLLVLLLVVDAELDRPFEMIEVDLVETEELRLTGITVAVDNTTDVDSEEVFVVDVDVVLKYETAERTLCFEPLHRVTQLNRTTTWSTWLGSNPKNHIMMS